MAWNTGFSSPSDELMISSTSDVAARCRMASDSRFSSSANLGAGTRAARDFPLLRRPRFAALPLDAARRLMPALTSGQVIILAKKSLPKGLRGTSRRRVQSKAEVTVGFSDVDVERARLLHH
jgi:hypothetical protein